MRKVGQQNRRSNHSRQQMDKSSVSYDSFIFVDNLTNNKIILKDARKKYESRHRTRQTITEHKKSQFESINECINTLKTTKLFQMDSLKSKLFKSAHHSRNPTIDNEQESLHHTKHGLRQFIEMSITDLSIKEMRECLDDPKRPINPHIMSLQAFKRCSLTKTNLLKLMKKVDKKNQPLKVPHTPKQYSQIEIREQKELRQKVQHFLNVNRSNNSFLVQPDSKHELYQKLYSACSRHHQKLNKKLNTRPVVGFDEEGVFKPITAGKIADNLQRRMNQKQNKQYQQQQQILYAVENNLFFDLQFLANTHKSLIHTRDKQGNNLLHIAAKNRNLQFFQFILKRAGSQGLQTRNNLGKTPLDLAKLYGVSQIVAVIESYSPFG